MPITASGESKSKRKTTCNTSVNAILGATNDLLLIVLSN